MTGNDAARLIVHKLLEMAWQTEVDGGDSMQEISTAIAFLEAITNGVFDGEYDYTPKAWKSHHNWVDEVVAGNEWIDPWDYTPVAPTVDAVPVVHGEWIEGNRRPKSGKFCCSVCHMDCYDIQPTRATGWKKRCRYSYCPNCGAKMDGERKGEEED